MEIYIKLSGVLLIALAIIHLVFPRRFNWSEQLSSLTLMNRQMMYVHTFFIALTLLLMGILCLTSADELLNTEFGKNISLGLGIFWTIRLLIQFFGYSSELWRGKKFETIVHIVFSLIWFYFSLTFLLTYLI